MWSLLLRATSAGDVAGLFFPRLAGLGLRVEATVSPRVEQRMTFAGANSASYEEAFRILKELADLEIKPERIRRATIRHGRARQQLMQRLEEEFLRKPLPVQTSGGPADASCPPIAVVMCDGGKYQRFDRNHPRPESGSFWREDRVACLVSMKPIVYNATTDAALPDFLKDVSIAKKLAAIGHVPGENPSPVEGHKEDPPWQRSTLLSKEVVASSKTWKEFGPHVASNAWYKGFMKATDRVFLSDGAASIEDLQQRWLAGFVSILDLLHCLSYSLAAARAIHSDQEASWQCYVQFATLIWQGKVDEVIQLLDQYQQELGNPPDGSSQSDPREVVRTARVYYRNHRSRMNYPEYRRKGYPIFSSLAESTVKQVNRRVKGTEKYWSRRGGDAVLQLRADYISDSHPMNSHWEQAINNADGTRTYNLCA